LKVMTIVALIFTPLVLAYQGWTYWVFRKRVRREDVEQGQPTETPA
ncbi:MAG TPA: cytochrome d ubiquinol oxidase subunit II, partial [Actinomycetota bacterium]